MGPPTASIWVLQSSVIHDHRICPVTRVVSGHQAMRCIWFIWDGSYYYFHFYCIRNQQFIVFFNKMSMNNIFRPYENGGSIRQHNN